MSRPGTPTIECIRRLCDMPSSRGAEAFIVVTWPLSGTTLSRSWVAELTFDNKLMWMMPLHHLPRRLPPTVGKHNPNCGRVVPRHDRREQSRDSYTLTWESGSQSAPLYASHLMSHQVSLIPASVVSTGKTRHNNVRKAPVDSNIRQQSKCNVAPMFRQSNVKRQLL